MTEFLPSPVRPPTYPAGFPFLPGRACHTTESPAHQMSPGVHWRCDDPDTVLTALIDMSLAEGWTAMAASDVEPIMRENLKAAFRRGNDIRQFSRIELDQGSIVSMLDLPGDW